MMPTEMVSSAQQDESAVAAVQRGDAERYRELVERHERRVYAVAWSRLGDAALAEEVTQEAFIRAYRRLWLLGDGAKFAGWVNTIARRLAINFGLRHRRELNKRERWALENSETSTTDHSAADTDAPYTPETLRQTLAELPDAHRECLVLFYLEGKSGAEAAAALGISEGALRVRLHRARAAMRERLEEKLEGSLAKLRPAQTLVPAIMAGVLASSSAKAATAGGVGATLIGALAKFAPVKWAFAIFPLFFVLPMMLASWLMLRSELANFRDAKGFRARIFREDIVRRLVWVPVLIIVVLFVVRSLALKLDEQTMFLTLAAFGLVTSAAMGRKLVINRSRYFVFTVLSSSFWVVGFLMIGLHWAPRLTFSLFFVPQLVMSMLLYRERPVRMDYSLFLRASEGLLAFSTPPSSPAAGRRQFTKSDLLAFGHFLGSRWMADNYRWTTEGLALRLPPYKSSFWTMMSFISSWSHRSRLLLAWDGKVSAHLGGKDRKSLREMHPHDAQTQEELESQVVAAVETAWNHFRESRFAPAERVLGQVPEGEVFHVPPTRSRLVQWRTWGTVMLVAIVVGLNGLVLFKPMWLKGLKPVSVSEAEVRAFLNDTTPRPDPKKFKFNSPGLALFTCLILPPTNLFSPEGLRAMRDEVAGEGGFDSLKQGNQWGGVVFGAPLVRLAVAGGWISWSDLEIQPADSAAWLRTNRSPRYSPGKWDYLLTRCRAWSWVKAESYNVMRIHSDGVTQLQLLRAVNCLDLTDREKLIQQIASVQTLSGTPPDQPPIHDWRDVSGLFFTPCYPALQDTYFSLAALEILGGIDKIDREACIRGILQRHEGKGYFTSPDSGGFNEYHIDGSARDTIAAYESLRILGALDRVKDLEKWQFRVNSRHTSKPATAGEIRTPTWDEVEAWICQQRWEGMLRVRRENPRAPFRSLLEP